MTETTDSGDLPFSRRILLVEDTPINQVLVKKMLCHLNQQVETADNGAEALEMIGRDHFDLVLMDIQMPVMDGITATRKIREMGRRMPVLALSAYTMENNQQDSIAAGCNEFLPKPIKKCQLREALLRWLDKDEPIPFHRTESIPSSQSDGDRQQAVIHSTLLAEDPEMEPLVVDYVQNLPGTLHRLEENLARADEESLAQGAHRLKGTGGGFGYQQLTDLAAQLEKEALAGEPEACGRIIPRLRETLSRIELGLKAPGRS